MEYYSFTDEKAWLEALLEHWQQVGGLALHERGLFRVALSGGETPRLFYQQLAKLSDWPWSATKFFIGDERLFPVEQKDTNYKMIYEAFYPRKIQLERWKTELPRHEDAAADYEKRIRNELSDPPRFDLVLLGIGEDGHIASLFPNTTALLEETKLTAVNHVPQNNAFRFTITYPLLRYARAVCFLAKGKAKEKVLEKIKIGKDTTSPAAVLIQSQPAHAIFHCEA